MGSMTQASELRLGGRPGLCSACGARAHASCPRCVRPRCRFHRPEAPDRRCADCEAEFRPFSPANIVLRVPVSAIGAFLGAAAGLALALVAGALVYGPTVEIMRLLAIVAAMAGAGVGVGTANVLTTALLRARFLEEQTGTIDMPPARAIAGAASGARRHSESPSAAASSSSMSAPG